MRPDRPRPMARAAALALVAAVSCSPSTPGPGGGAGAAAGSTVPTGSSVEAPGAEVGLERLIDGDSMELVIEGEVVEVRLLGINAPELRTVADADSCNGQQAKEAMAGLLAGGDLRFRAGHQDRFGRVLGVLLAGQQDLNAQMVAQGWALGLWSADDGELVPLMREAAQARRGMWGDSCGEPAALVEISGHQVDAPGRDEDNLDEEWVEIANRGQEPVDLSGWSVADETTSNRFPLPAVALAPGRALRIHTGAGPSPEAELHLGQDHPVWNNRGETVLVIDPAGRIAGHRFVGS